MLVPYRVKNPTKRFPVATVSIIAINVIVFFCTTNMLEIRESVVRDYAFALGASPILNFFSACFLHADIFHIGGNMLFLWVFGPPVEDRLGIGKYVALYFITGFSGDILQALLGYAEGGPSPGIGASGCIMGVVGAYWYMYSWSTVCVFYWFGLIWTGVWEVAAIWIIGLYFLMDVMNGMVGRMAEISGGVANFCHVGGAITGALMCIMLRMKRDTAELSEAKAVHADMHDVSMLPLHALQRMLEDDPQNPQLLRALVKPASSLGQSHLLDQAMARAGLEMIEKDPGFVAYYLTMAHGSGEMYRPAHLLRLAGTLERTGQPVQAQDVYRLIVDRYPGTPDAESALYRMALCYWSRFSDAEQAKGCLRQMASSFPNGPMTPFGRKLWGEIVEAAKQAR